MPRRGNPVRRSAARGVERPICHSTQRVERAKTSKIFEKTMRTNPSTTWLPLIATVAMLVAVCTLLVWMVRVVTPQSAQAQSAPEAAPSNQAVPLAGPDLTIEMSLNPAAPGVGEAADLDRHLSEYW